VVGQLGRLFAERDYRRLRDVLHRLKGSAGMYGFAQVSQAAAEAETGLGGEDEGVDDAPAAAASSVQELIDLVRRVEGYPVGGELGDEARHEQRR
jgi:HPt (histidine-containing phosphotransfer) domain-containing protein